MGKFALLSLLLFLNRNSSGLVTLESRRAWKHYLCFIPNILVNGEMSTGFIGSNAGLLSSCLGGGAWGNSWFKVSGWAREGTSHCTQPPSGTKAVITALQPVPVPHVWHEHSCFLQRSRWGTSDAAHELCFVVCLGQHLFLMVGRDYKERVLWVLFLNFGRVG